MKQAKREGMGGSGWVSAALLVGAVACGANPDDEQGKGSGGVDDLEGPVSAGLLRAEDCDDLLTKIQDDAVKKLDLAVASYRTQSADHDDDGLADGFANGGPVSGGAIGRDEDNAEGGGNSGGSSTGSGGDGVAAPSDPVENAGGQATSGDDPAPSDSSGTNTQVKGVDEADFVKVVKMGERILLLNGADLYTLDSWPAAETQLRGNALRIEGSPSEMFATDDGSRAVIFSSVYGYGATQGGGEIAIDEAPTTADIAKDVCAPEYCGGDGSTKTKVTLADVSGEKPKVLRELYFDGNYVSSRRYDGIVRGVIQSSLRYQGLYQPDFKIYDPWGRLYAEDVIADQLVAWRERTVAAIRATKLEDWIPIAQEAKDGKLVSIEPSCGDYFVPRPGLSEYGLTHVFSLDIEKAAGELGGVTIMGATSTVYSSAERLVLAQPDYRAFGTDFGLIDLQETALHVFDIDGAATRYAASGWIPGQISYTNPQFGIDEKDGVVRVATTGWVRTKPNANPDSSEFWERTPQNLVVIAKDKDGALEVVGKTKNLGHEGETIHSVRFVGDRAYVVTFRQTDPLIVVDVAKAEEPTVLGEVEIPGFSEYIHPLDDDHLLTLGQREGWGIQLQLFDVSNPTAPKRTSVLDFGNGSYSQASYNHKAFTYYAPEQLLAVPVNGYYYDDGMARSVFTAGLQVVHVDVEDGLALRGTVDHGSLLKQQSCGACDEYGCYDLYCGYSPEVSRGHFVSSDDATFVYSFSNSGVLVNDLSDLKTPVATVVLPQLVYSGGTFYGDGSNGGDSSGVGSSGSTGGNDGAADAGVVVIDPAPANGGSDAR